MIYAIKIRPTGETAPQNVKRGGFEVWLKLSEWRGVFINSVYGTVILSMDSHGTSRTHTSAGNLLYCEAEKLLGLLPKRQI